MNVETGHVERFRRALGSHLGLRIDDAETSRVGEVLAARLRATSLRAEEYLGRLESASADRVERRALARELTVGESYFFRNPGQLRAFTEAVVTDRLRRRGSTRRLEILSAGCSSGEEPYTLAMLLRDSLPTGWAAVIRAVDVDAAALARAAEGVYSEWALRETPDAVRRRWFVRQGGRFALVDEVRRAVEFEERNLADAEPGLWLPGAYDVIFCRNVLMYFTPRKARELSERIAAALAPGGYLFLGHAETLRGLSSAFRLMHTHDSFYYQRREDVAATVGGPDLTGDASAPGPVSLVPHVEAAGSWVEAIARASERIRELDDGGSRPSAATSRTPWDLGLAMELLRAERFGEALELLSRLPEDAHRDSGVLLLRATLLTHSGALAEAEGACLELLGSDDCNAEAHYLVALCREGLGDLSGADHHDHLAAHLDPGFAMPRLHLGLMARRAGRGAVAGRELTEALDLLSREEPSRLLLFGGGFNRAALEALCAAELAACGGVD